MIKKVLLGLVFTLYFLFSADTTQAQTCILSSNPSQPEDGSPAGDLSTTFNIFASGCVDGSYYIALELNGNEYANYQVQIESGSLQNQFQFEAPAAGTINVILHQFFTPFATLSLVVSDANPPQSYSCGDLVPLDEDGFTPDTDPCPSECPFTDRDQVGEVVYHCQCGILNTAPCPPGKGRPLEGCANEAMIVIGGLCKNVDSVLHTTAFLVGQGCGSELGSVNTAIGCIPFESINLITKFFLQWGISVGGGIALFLIAVAGFMFATSSGDPKKLENSKALFFSSIGGLLMIVLSVFLLQFIGVNILGLFS